MADTRRTLTELQTLFADNTTAQISAQDLRDFLVSALLNTITEVAAITYEIDEDDCFLHVAYTSTNTVAITWPTELLTDSRMIRIKDADGNASGNNITLTPESGTIDGAADFTINADYAAYTFYCWDGDLYVL